MANMTERTDSTLRQRAEDSVCDKAALSPTGGAALSSEAMRQLLHELQVHQVELEMQNDELRRTQLQLDAARERYFDLYDLAPVGYCTVSEPGLILEANFTAAALLGLVRSDLVKQPVSRFIVKVDQDIYYQCRKALFAEGNPQECELQMCKRDGTTFWMHLKTTAAQDGAGARVQRLVLSDITERKRADAVLKEKNIELEKARSVAEKANQAKSDFLSNMSHELRSPLNAILGFAQLMELGTPPPSPNQMGSIDQILRAGWYLLDLINEILDLALIESGNLTLLHEPVSLPEVLLDCQAMVEPLAKKRDIHLHFPQFESAHLVDADRTRLKQVLINLLSNAVKYNRVGGSVEVSCSQDAMKHLRISVRDTGEGLSVPRLTQLFQPFNRLGQESKAEEGTGIGLVMSKRLVDLMGGTIGVQSTLGVGSVFWIELNLSNASEESSL